MLLLPYEYLNEEISGGIYFDREENKSIFCFFINILLCHFDLVVSWIVRIDDLLIVHIFISFFN